MSYDLMVFETAKAPKTKRGFIKWYKEQTKWREDHDYETISVTSHDLQNWFMEMKDTFPPMNGEYAPDVDLIDEDENLEAHITDYSIGYDVIYAAFSWSLANDAYNLVTQLAVKHKVGFYDVSGNGGDIIMPDGTKIK